MSSLSGIASVSKTWNGLFEPWLDYADTQVDRINSRVNPLEISDSVIQLSIQVQVLLEEWAVWD